MELFERVALIAEQIAGSKSKIAKALKIPQTTFSYYFSAERQVGLWPLLPAILELYPQINKYWLHFEEGEMIGSGKPTVNLTEINTWRDKYTETLEELNKALLSKETVRECYERARLEDREKIIDLEKKLDIENEGWRKATIAYNQQSKKYSKLQMEYRVLQTYKASLEQQLKEAKANPQGTTSGDLGAPTLQETALGASKN